MVNILSALNKKHQESIKIDRLTQPPEELCPPETTLLLVHSPSYLQQLKERSIEAAGESGTSAPVLPAKQTPLVFETDSGITDAGAKGNANDKSPKGLGNAFGASNLEQVVAMDTYVSSKSWDVARAAAGTVCMAVDRVVRKEFHNAVCLVRPPGHHVGRNGRTTKAPSSGFCLLNNVVVGAVHARLYPWIRKIAVLDWDIHHGNGTEELLKDDPDAFFSSIHLYAGGDFFPGTGKECNEGNLVNVALENSGAGSGSAAFRAALQDKVLPAMRAFGPDIIFISAGFDGHKDDILGGRAAIKDTTVPAGYVEEDYAWATQEVLRLAAECCDGRVVSVLEGGYDVRKETNALAKSVAAHIGAIASYELAQKSVHAAKEEDAKLAFKQELGLLEKLLATDLNDASVVIVDDDDETEDATAAGATTENGEASADDEQVATHGDVEDEEEEDDEEEHDVEEETKEDESSNMHTTESNEDDVNADGDVAMDEEDDVELDSDLQQDADSDDGDAGGDADDDELMLEAER